MCEGCAWYHEGWFMNCQHYCTMPTECEPTVLGFIVLAIILAIIIWKVLPLMFDRHAFCNDDVK